MGRCCDRAGQHLILDAGDDLHIHVALSGNGPPLLLLHGFTGSADTWQPFRETLEQSYTVIALDLPGHGQSSSPLDAERYKLGRLSDDIAHALDILGIASTAVMGYSMGGRAAIHFTLSHPGRVAALILESTSAGITDDSLRAERAKSDAELASFIEREGITKFVDRWESLPLWESQSRMPEIALRSLREQRLKNNPLGLANSLRGAGAGADAPVHDRLASIDCPSLVIAGERDARYVEIARLLTASIPGARLSIIPEAGHAAHLERPDDVLAALTAFLGSLPCNGDRWG